MAWCNAQIRMPEKGGLSLRGVAFLTVLAVKDPENRKHEVNCAHLCAAP